MVCTYISRINGGTIAISPKFLKNITQGKTLEQRLALADSFEAQSKLPIPKGIRRGVELGEIDKRAKAKAIACSIRLRGQRVTKQIQFSPPPLQSTSPSVVIQDEIQAIKEQEADPQIELSSSTAAFEVGSTIGAASFTPATTTVVNPQSRSIIRIDTSQSGLANNVAKITLNVLVRDSAFLGKTITTNVIDSNTGLRFGGSTSNFILRDRGQKVSNIVWIESRERISGQVILSLQDQDFSRGANFEFQSTTIPDLPCPTGFHRDPITQLCTEDTDGNGNGEEEERNLFNTAIIGAIGIGVLASMMGNKK